MEFFSKNMNFLRKRKRLTQAEIKEKIGVEPTTWSNYERGKSYPNLKLFCKISNFFEVTETELLHSNLGKRDPKKLNEEFNAQKASISNIQETDERYLSLKDELIAVLRKEVLIMEQSLSDKDRIISYLEEKLSGQEESK